MKNDLHSGQQSGFTLIELVVVIVILGILAVVAAPKFLNLQGDSKASTLAGLKGAILGADNIFYGHAAAQGKEKSTDYVVSQGEKTIALYYGIVHDWGTVEEVITNQLNALSITEQTWGPASTPTGGYAITFLDNITGTGDNAKTIRNCYLDYSVEMNSMEKTATKSLNLVSDGC
ncbi:prepilin-type N-terminal cleavage/methylation domain-containing protein [Vibrio cholerae]